MVARTLPALSCGAALCASAAPAQDLPAVKKSGVPRVLAVPVNEGPLIAGGFTDTPARRAQAAFTVEVFPTRDVVVTRQPNPPVTTMEQLRKAHVGTIKGTRMSDAVAAAGVARWDDDLPPGGVQAAPRARVARARSFTSFDLSAPSGLIASQTMQIRLRPLPWTLIAAALALPALAGDWPNWRGPYRTGVSDDRGLVSRWSRAGENLLWKANLTARATPVVFDGRVCTSGRGGTGPTRHELVACFDAQTGKELWTRRFPIYNTTVPFTRAGWAALGADPETGYVFAQNVDGHLVALDRAGKTVWQHRMGEEYGRGSGFGGRTLIPLVDEDRVIVGVVGAGWGDIGPPRHRYMAFDKRTGVMRWVSTPAQGPFDDANNQSSPTAAVVGGRRLMIGGGADGWLYALESRTGAPVWRFHVSVRGLNSPPVVEGDVVYAAHSEENVDGGVMGRVVAIDGKGSGDITKTGEIWRADGIAVGFAAPTVAAGRVYVVDNAANLHALDQKTGRALWVHSLGTIGRAAPVFADGRIYTTEENGAVLIVEPGPTGARTLHTERIIMPEGRHAEIWGSVAVAYGRLYFTAEDGLYCVGRKGAPFKATATVVKAAAEPAPAADAKAARLIVVPAEVIAPTGAPLPFEAWSFDDKGAFLRKEQAVWSVDGLQAAIDGDGRLTANGPATTAGKVKATVGDLTATTQVRLFAPLPWTFDFEGGAIPRHWIGSGPRFKVADLGGGKRLQKPPQEVGLQRAAVFVGPPTLSGYTVEADVMFTRQGRRAGDLGLIDQGYTLDLMGKKQELQLRTWASELEKSVTLPFAAEPDVWYRMKLRVDTQGEKGTARGKVWKKEAAEPAEWSITLEDPQAVPEGAPGLYGDSVTDLYWDNITVKGNDQ
jgi:outer membrane protein assembly factor BamB